MRIICERSKIALANVAIPLARDNLTGLVSNFTSNPKTEFDGKISGKLWELEKYLFYLLQMKIWMMLLKL